MTDEFFYASVSFACLHCIIFKSSTSVLAMSMGAAFWHDHERNSSAFGVRSVFEDVNCEAPS